MAPSPSRTDVSVVIAAYQEAATIEGVVARCRAHTPDLLEVLVVDDGCTDDTAARAAAAGARVLSLGRNRGKGAAIRAGLAAAKGERVVLLDGDGQDDPAEIPRLLDALTPDVAMVLGSRFLGRFAPGSIRPIDRLGTLALNATLNLLYNTRLTDVIAGFRALRKSAVRLDRLRAARYDIEVDLCAKVLRAGGRIVEVPVNRYPREHGRSHLHAIRDGTRILIRIVRGRIE